MKTRYSVFWCTCVHCKQNQVNLTSCLCACLPALRGLYRSPDGVLFHRWLNLALSSWSVVSSSSKILRDYKTKNKKTMNWKIVNLSHTQLIKLSENVKGGKERTQEKLTSSSISRFLCSSSGRSLISCSMLLRPPCWITARLFSRMDCGTESPERSSSAAGRFREANTLTKRL